MKRVQSPTSLAVITGALILGASIPARAESDPKAVAVADQVLEAMGGKDAWNGTHFLRFDFAVEHGGKTVVSHAHTWDKWTGRYRLEAKTKAGDPYVVLMNVNTKLGDAYLKGKKLEGAEANKYVKEAYETWVNDTYWLVMPYKMKDPGVTLKLDGEAKEGTVTYDRVSLSFDSVGLTPRDHYTAYINRGTHMMDKWEFVLEGEKPPAVPFMWKNWQRYGKVMLSNDKVNTKDGTRIYFPVLDAPAAVTDAVFTSPEVPAARP
jgi:hypothetical protein